MAETNRGFCIDSSATWQNSYLRENQFRMNPKFIAIEAFSFSRKKLTRYLENVNNKEYL